MRNILIPSILAVTAAVARAQPADPVGPVSRPSACTVDIVRAPDDVRDTVEGWVGGELRCAVALEVRIVRTDGGLYLLARDDRGRAFERIVPDAESAGALIASWAADDSVAAAAPAPAPPRPVRVAVDAAPIAPPITPPSAWGVAAIAAPVPSAPARRLSVAASFDLTDSNLRGARAQLDLWERRGWSFGAALSIEGTDGSFMGDVTYRAIDVVAVARVGRRVELGGWAITPGIGVGASFGRSEQLSPYGDVTDGGTTSVAEGSLLVSRALGRRLELTAGPIGRWFPRGWNDPQPVSVSIVAGLGWRL